jgi:hypothetical protein
LNRPPTLRKKPKDLRGLDIELCQDEYGVLHLAEGSSGTATMVQLTFPLLESEVRRAMDCVQQRKEQDLPGIR